MAYSLPLWGGVPSAAVKRMLFRWRAKGKKWRDAPPFLTEDLKRSCEPNKHQAAVLERLRKVNGGSFLFGPVHDPIQELEVTIEKPHFKASSRHTFSDPEDTAAVCSAPCTAYLACYLRCLLIPSNSTLETITASSSPLENVFLPPYVSEHTKNVLSGVLSGRRKNVDLRSAFGRGLGDVEVGDIGVGGEGFISGYCLFPNGAAIGRVISVAAQGLHRGETMAGIVTGWLWVVAKLRAEVERGRWKGEEPILGVDGAGVAGWEGWGIVAQKLALISEAMRAKKMREEADGGEEDVGDVDVGVGDEEEDRGRGGDYDCADGQGDDDEFHDAQPDLPISPSKPRGKKSASMTSSDGSTTVRFPRRKAPPLTIDTVLQRKMMLELSEGDGANYLSQKFTLPLVASDMQSYKYTFKAEASFEEFLNWSEDKYDYRFKREVLEEEWGKVSGVHPERQDLGYDCDVAIERALHFLESIPPYVLFNQLLSVSFSNAYYTLLVTGGNRLIAAGNGTARRAGSELRSQIAKTCALLGKEIEEGECVTEFREENMLEQDTIIELEKSIQMLNEVEKLVTRSLSLGHKTGIWDGLCKFDFEKFVCMDDAVEVDLEEGEEKHSVAFMSEAGDGRAKEVSFCEVWEHEEEDDVVFRSFGHFVRGGSSVKVNMCSDILN